MKKLSRKEKDETKRLKKEKRFDDIYYKYVINMGKIF